MSHVHRETWPRAPQSGAGRAENHWPAFWDRLEEHVIFRVEAADYVIRLEAVLSRTGD